MVVVNSCKSVGFTKRLVIPPIYWMTHVLGKVVFPLFESCFYQILFILTDSKDMHKIFGMKWTWLLYFYLYVVTGNRFSPIKSETKTLAMKMKGLKENQHALYMQTLIVWLKQRFTVVWMHIFMANKPCWSHMSAGDVWAVVGWKKAPGCMKAPKYLCSW